MLFRSYDLKDNRKWVRIGKTIFFENNCFKISNDNYMGFYDKKWNEKFGEYSDINRMSGFGKKANTNSFSDISDIITKIKNKGADIFITFNSASYSEEELEFVRNYVIKLSETNIDGVILSNPELMDIAIKAGLPVVISTIAGVYNSDMVKYYKKSGAKRIILPRDLSMNEIENIIEKDKSMEYEIFIMRNGCKFSDSNCLGFHRTEMCSICASGEKSDNESLISEDNFVLQYCSSKTPPNFNN